ncbi:TonB-dependent receptor [Sphingomonas sp. MMSM20]|uniref:TonB-dependent receptor n=1 Tax=Sphingomonas lycopersici TaxID=2951807 RepID=UPI0022371D2E|nr:TonB-dependent receptor [Sphingomonas lycopersici]MCW6530769.1 TonB-dependent receptor [Sphingomonas lycopersici]
MKKHLLVLFGSTAIGVCGPAYAARPAATTEPARGKIAPAAPCVAPAGAPGGSAGVAPCIAPSTAGEAGRTDLGTNDIIVTAQKRSERLSDVPVSITAVSGAHLADIGITRPSDLEKIAPGLTYRPSTYGSPVFTIRGIGFYDVAVAVAPTVSVYSDQVPVPYLAMTEGVSFDVERVEVLKGPQGTLFGQNSTGGAINYIPAKPTDTLTSGFDLTYGRFNEVDAQAFVSGPIAGNLNGRLAVRHEYADGWQISQSRPLDRLGRRDFTTGRMILDWEQGPVRLEFNANGWINKSETQAGQFMRYDPQVPASAGGYTDLQAALLAIAPAPKNSRIADWDPGVSLRRDDYFYQFSLRGDVDLSDSIKLTSISAYSRFKQWSPVDTDGVPVPNMRLTIDARIESFSQELRVAGQSGPLRWMIGGNYSHDKTDDREIGNIDASNSGVGPYRYREFTIGNAQKIDAKAVFGSVDYEIVRGLTLQASARYNDQTNRFRGCLYDSGNGDIATVFSFLSNLLRGFTDPVVALKPGACATLGEVGYGTPLVPVPIVEKRLSQDNVSWRAGLNWKPTQDTLLYANVTKGYKAGSFPTVPGLFPTQFDPVTQESVLAVEAGFKVAALNRRLQLNGAGFYYKYNDKQIAGYVATAFGNLPSLVQIPRSSVRGGELTINWRPVEGLTLNGGVTYVDTRIDRSFVTNDPDGTAINVKGASFPGTPKWQMNADIDYHVPLDSTLELTMGGNLSYRSKVQAAFGNLTEFEIPGYALLDLRLGLGARDSRWKVQLWGRNVTNKFYLTNVTDVVDTVVRLTGKPATYGITLSYRY